MAFGKNAVVSMAMATLPLLNVSSTLAASVATSAEQTADSDGLEAVIITASKVNTKLGDMTQSALVVTEDDINGKAQVDLTEVLRQTPSIEFKKAGGPGQFNYLRLRGFSDGILFVMDGVVMNDGNSGGIGNVVGQIDPTVVARIEVLRGPHATLYGANTTAGVISITTKGGDVAEAKIATEAGSLQWKKTYGSFRDNWKIGSGQFNFALNGSITNSGGVNQYEYYKDKTVSSKLSYITDVIEVGSSFYRTNNRFQYAELKEASCCQTPATYWSFQMPDPNQYSPTVDTIGSIWLQNKFSESWNQKLQVSGMEKIYNTFDANNGLLGYQPSPLDNFVYSGVTYAKGSPIPIYDTTRDIASYTTGNNRQADYNLTYNSDYLTALFGVGYLVQKYAASGSYGVSNTKQSVKSAYGDFQLPMLNDRLHPEVGARLDDYNAWGNKTTFSGGVAYDFQPVTAVYANYGTSFTQPTLSQLFNPTYGNSDLSPASGKTIEGGLRQQAFDKRLSFNLAVYQSKVDNVIVYDYTIPNPRTSTGFGLYHNRDGSKSQGVELQARYEIDSSFSVDTSYTYTDAKVKTAGGAWTRMIQVARSKANVGLNYKTDAVELGANVYYVGPRLRWAGDVSTDGYTRLDLSGRYHVTTQFSVYGRVQNALDSHIIEEVGYKQPGLYGIFGAELKFF